MEEFSAHGYVNTTMNAVAARIGMTKGALYGHFASKEELTAAIIRQGDTTWQRIQAECSPSGTPPLPALQAVVTALARALREDIRIKAAYRLMADGAPGGGSAQGFFPDVQRHVAGLVRRAQDAGTISSDNPPGETARLLLAVVLGTHSAALLPPGIGFALGIESAWGMLSDALTASKST
ncbi:hypothetical protein GCM10010193_36420 [Kitasatospora atroaurantiaca]|uniref:TetR family transcriptional regulator n=1 Tax=Kitasatospora atroaurantiaca TaxID=285545 RepID=A0A561ET83_9ACTN|nr:TetR/AcrR family transcriptional regulator [Kitasatospora atroaurantiaca]TWE18813.1 TetR family transcriptional regulator [Kitasatospora atroaurantiaca]